MGLYAWPEMSTDQRRSKKSHRFKGGYLQLFQCLIQFVGDKEFTEINTVTYERMSEVHLFLGSLYQNILYPVIQETQKQMAHTNGWPFAQISLVAKHN